MPNRGDINKKTGKVFWAMARSCKNGEHWVSPERFQLLKQSNLKKRSSELREKEKARRRERYKTDQEYRNRHKQWSEKRYKKLCESGKISDVRKKNYLKRMENPIYYLRHVCRARLHAAFKSKGSAKPSKTELMIGCGYEKLKKHIENMFKIGMSWENKGEWHIDHIIPLSSASTIQETIRLCHYTNLQPLWANENIRKGNKI
jgi:hypothetical protein